MHRFRVVVQVCDTQHPACSLHIATLQQRLDTLKTKHRLNQDLLAVIGQAIHKAQKEAVLAAADQ